MILKRLAHEFKNCDNYKILNMSDNKKKISIDYKSNTYDIILSESYPFQSPYDFLSLYRLDLENTS